jgi:hypothetical protein
MQLRPVRQAEGEMLETSCSTYAGKLSTDEARNLCDRRLRQFEMRVEA